jgi:hypothetical protein
MMSTADAMRQMTMKQCYKRNSVVAAASVASTPSPVLPAHISCMPHGFHYFAINGMDYFLNLMTSKKVKLGPVELSRTSSLIPVDLDDTSFVTPSVKKKERTKRDSMVHSENDEEVVCIRCKKNKRIDSPVACNKVVPAKLIVVDNQEEAKGE